jgi:hypothetical protein
MKVESWEIRFSGKCDVIRVKTSRLFEIASVLVRFDHIARLIVTRITASCERL